VAGQGNGPTLTPDDRSSVIEGNYDFYNRTKLTSLNVTWNLDGHKLSYIGGFQQGWETDDRDIDIANVIPNWIDQQLVKIKSLQRTHEVRFESTDAKFWNYMFGLYYAKNDASARFTQPYTYFFPVPYGVPMEVQLEGYTGPGSYGKGSAFFTDHRFALTANDIVEVGARHQKNESYSQQYVAVFGTVSAALPENLAHRSTSHWTGSASYKHTFNKDVMAYVSYAGGYRPGGAVNFVTAAGLDPNYILYKPEKSNSIELGVKSSFLNRKVTLNADIFQQKIKDYIGRANAINVRTAAVPGEAAGPGPGGTYPADAATGGINFNTNGDVIARGVEATANWRVNPDWRVQLSASYVDSHYDNASLYCNDSNNDGKPDNAGTFVQPGRQVSVCRSSRPVADTSGNEPGRLNAVLQSEYTHDIGNYEGFVRGLVRYKPASYNLAMDTRIASFTPVDLYVGLRDPEQRWELSLWSQNLFDRSTNSVSTLSYVGGLPGGYRGVDTPQKRRVGVTLRYDFGM
jgi:iron complex outermembrane receptor protein